ncbi:MAG: DUF5694 domain-containing protein [Asticcacaulis sp.]
MRLSHFLALMVVGVFFSVAAKAADRSSPTTQDFRPVDINVLKPALVGKSTDVLVLGTAHLSDLDQLADQSLDRVVEKLAAYRPDLITIEALSGEECKRAVEGRVLYERVATYFCNPYLKLAVPAQQTLGLSLYQALDEIDKTLSKDPKTLSPSERRRLAALFCAAGEPVSAIVQWLSLPATERRAGDGLTEDLAAALQRRASQKSEDIRIAARLAVKLGLQRVYSVDEQNSDRIRALAGPDFESAVEALWAGLDGKSALMDQLKAEERKMVTPEDVLKFYQRLNSRELQVANLNNEWKEALQDASEKTYGRQYLAWWETRNLRMVSNIRQVTANRPGSRVLVLVGRDHKVFFDHILNQSHDIRVIDAAHILK